MELLLLLLAPSIILAQRYHPSSASSSSNPNDQPFLPIYPIYPYSPKLIKRGTERDLLGQLTPELYAPKLDARDTYTASFGPNYQRDPYYPSYNPYPKQTTTSSASSGPNYPTTTLSNPTYNSATSFPTSSYSVPSAYSGQNVAYTSPNAAYTSPNSHYSTAAYSNPYPYSPSPYSLYNSYSPPYTPQPNPYSSGPYNPPNYPNYNYQAPYYYPNYYNQPYPALPPPPPSQAHDYSSSEEDTSEESIVPKTSGSGKKSSSKKNRHKDNESADNSAESKEGQFVDGGNYLSSSGKDLDGQPSSYKTPSSYNQLEQGSDVHLRSVSLPGLPRTTYRVISVGGQPVGPDYPLPQSYAKVQQLEQIMTQTLAKLLAQNAGNQANQQYQYQYQNNQQNDNFGAGFGTQANKTPVIAKTGLAYIVNPTNLGKLRADPQQYIPSYGNNGQNPLLIKVQDPNQSIQQASTILSKAAGKYADGHYGQKTVTTVSLQQAPGVYIPPEAKNNDKDDSSSQAHDFNDYDSSSGQNYDNSGGYKKNEENYSIDQGQGPVAYHNSNLVTVQTPQSQSYQYSSYLPTQSTHQQQQQARDYKTSLDDVNFGTKRDTKV